MKPRASLIRACSWEHRSWRRWEASFALVCWFCTSNPCPAARSWWLRQLSCWIWRRRSQTGHKGQWQCPEVSAGGMELVGLCFGFKSAEMDCPCGNCSVCTVYVHMYNNQNWDVMDSQRNCWDSGSMPCSHPCGGKRWKRWTCFLFSSDFPFSYQNCLLEHGDGTALEKFISRKHCPAPCHMGSVQLRSSMERISYKKGII